MRLYTSRRDCIVDALVEELKKIDGSSEFQTNLYENVEGSQKFWDEIRDFPMVCLNAGPESREYLGGGVRNRYMSVMVRCYVKDDCSVMKLNQLMEDVETVIEACSRLEYKDRQGKTQYTKQISVVSIDTDEGVLNPIGVGELQLEVMY